MTQKRFSLLHLLLAVVLTLGVTVGGSLMGVVGMLIFIPIVSTVYALLREDVNGRNRKRQSLKG